MGGGDRGRSLTRVQPRATHHTHTHDARQPWLDLWTARRLGFERSPGLHSTLTSLFPLRRALEAADAESLCSFFCFAPCRWGRMWVDCLIILAFSLSRLHVAAIRGWKGQRNVHQRSSRVGKLAFQAQPTLVLDGHLQRPSVLSQEPDADIRRVRPPAHVRV